MSIKRNDGASSFATLAGNSLANNAALVEKIWDYGIDEYVWPDGIEPSDDIYTNIIFVGPEDMRFATGGRDVEGDIWMSDADAPVSVVSYTVGSAQALDTAAAVMFDVTMTSNLTLSFTNPPTIGVLRTFNLILRGAYTPTFPASVDWTGGIMPLYATPSVYTFMTVDGGTTWLGFQAGWGMA